MTRQVPRRFYRMAIWPVLLVLVLCGSARANSDIGTWRLQADQARMLAENNAPAAYQEALRLQATQPADATPADRVRLLNLQARIEVYLALTDAAAAHTQQAFDLAKQHGDRVGQAEADLNIVLNAINQGRLDAMAAAAAHGMTILEGVNRPDLLGEAMLRMTMMYRRQGQFETSATIAMQAMEIAGRTNDAIALAYAHQGMANSFEQSDRLQEARYHFIQMREQARIAHMRRLEADALVGLGRVLGRMGDNPGSERLMHEAIAIQRAVGNPFGIAQGKYALADNLNRQGRIAATLPLINEVIAIYETYPNKIGLWWALIARSKNYQTLGRMDVAGTDAERAYKLAGDIGFTLYLGESAKRLAAIAAVRGNHRRAYALSVEADEMLAKADREQAGERMVELAKRYEAESKQHQIDELNQRNEQQNAVLRQHALQQRWLGTLAGSSLAILSVTVFFLLRLRRSHRQLQYSKTDQQAILDAVPDMLFELGLDGRFYECHCWHPALLAIPIEELLGKTVFDVMPQDAAEACLSALHEAHEKGISTGRQYGLPLPQGMGWFELSVARKPMGQGEVPRFVVLSRDITERKQQEAQEEIRLRIFERLAQGGDLLEILVLVVAYVEQARPDDIGCIMLLDADGKHLRLAVAPGLPQAFLAAIDGVAVGEGIGSCGTAAARGETVIVEDVREHPYCAPYKQPALQAGLRACWSQPIFDTAGKVLGTFTIYRREPGGPTLQGLELVRQASHLAAVVIERRRLQDALAEHEREFRTLVENSPDVIVRYDRECRRTYVNPAFVRLNGEVAFQVLSKTPAEVFLDKEQAQSYQAMLNYVMDNALDSEMQLEFHMPDGSKRCHHIRLVPEFDGAGNVRGVLAMGRDMTSAKETELQLQESSAMLRELAARNESVREAERKRIAQEIHDELGQMLNVMRLNVLVLNYQFGTSNPALQDKTRALLDNLDRTIGIVRDIVSALRPSVLSAGIVAALDWLTQEFSKNTGIACNLWTEKEVALNEAQVTAIFRIVQESLTNVLRHSGADLVEISLTRVRNGEAYLLEITDNGKGFDPDQPRKQKSLGLLGIQERSIMLGGSIKISSTLKKGTVLQVFIPVDRKALPELI